MKIIVCGAGRVGFGIAERLASEQHDVVVVDNAARLVGQVAERLDVRIVAGHAAHPSVLARAGAEDADMLIAVTLHDEVNMMACQVGHSLFDIPTKIARVRAGDYLQERWQNLFARQHMPIDVVMSPEIEVAEAVMQRLECPGAFELLRFVDGEILVAGIVCDEGCPLLNETLRDLRALFPDLQASIMAIQRAGLLHLPTGSETLQGNDLVYVAMKRDHARRVLKAFGRESQAPRRIVLAGGGSVGGYLAKRWEAAPEPIRVKIIEANRTRAEKIAGELDRTLVLHGDCLNRDLLREADIDQADSLVAVTNDDQVNLLACVLARQSGCPSNLCLVNTRGMESIVQELGLSSYVDPRAVTISQVLKQVRRGRIRQVRSVADGMGEIYEAEALDTSPLVGKALRTMHIGEGIRIGAVYRKDRVVMPDGDTIIEAGDRAILFSLAQHVRKVEKLFRVSFEFFE